MNPFETAREQASNVAQASGSDVATVEAVTQNIAAVTLVDGDRPFRATIPDNLKVTDNDTVVVGYTTSDSAYVENVLTQTEPPDTGGGVTVADRDTRVDVGTIDAGDGLYVFDDNGDALLSTNPLETNIGAGDVLYVTDDNDNVIYQWYCTSPYDISTTERAGELSVSDIDGAPKGIAWNNDGSTLYLVGNDNDSIYSLDCETNFDVRTASLSQTLDVSSEDSRPHSVVWNNDGSKLYITGNYSDAVYEYGCSTSFDISTASFSAERDVSGDDRNPYGMAWNDDGSKMYVVGSDNDAVYEYDCATAFDVTTTSLSSQFDVSSEDLTPEGVVWNDTGSKMYVAGATNDAVYEYDCATAFDISTASFTSQFDITYAFVDPTGVQWST